MSRIFIAEITFAEIMEKMDWDTSIDNIRSSKFRQWLIELHRLDQIKIPRALGGGNLTIHTFRDASGAAYAATVFAGVGDGSSVSVQLLTARSRMAPKKSTIPRLELENSGHDSRAINEFGYKLFKTENITSNILVGRDNSFNVD